MKMRQQVRNTSAMLSEEVSHILFVKRDCRRVVSTYIYLFPFFYLLLGKIATLIIYRAIFLQYPSACWVQVSFALATIQGPVCKISINTWLKNYHDAQYPMYLRKVGVCVFASFTFVSRRVELAQTRCEFSLLV